MNKQLQQSEFTMNTKFASKTRVIWRKKSIQIHVTFAKFTSNIKSWNWKCDSPFKINCYRGPYLSFPVQMHVYSMPPLNHILKGISILSYFCRVTNICFEKGKIPKRWYTRPCRTDCMTGTGWPGWLAWTGWPGWGIYHHIWNE